LGSHGEYFTNRNSTKNIQFPYNQYLGHYCLGIVYSRGNLDYGEEMRVYTKNQLREIPSVISQFEFFAQEKWKIASDKSGSGNTANIGSITYIQDILSGNGVFTLLGEEWFDQYWQNHGKITIQKIKNKQDQTGNYIKYDAKITDIKTFLQFKGKSDQWIAEHLVSRKTMGKTKDNKDG
jgi:hypothetical protein